MLVTPLLEHGFASLGFSSKYKLSFIALAKDLKLFVYELLTKVGVTIVRKGSPQIGVRQMTGCESKKAKVVIDLLLYHFQDIRMTI